MLKITIICATFAQIVAASLPPCCPQGFVVVATANGNLQCQRENDTAFVVFSSSPYRLIDCSNYSRIVIADNMTPQDNACVGLHHSETKGSELSVWQCKNGDPEKRSGVFQVNKCCPPGWFLDRQKKRCVKNGAGSEKGFSELVALATQRGYLAAVRYGGFYCKESLVDFAFGLEDVREMSIFVKSLNKTIDLINDFRQICLDDSQSNSIVVRVCTKKSFCEKNFCLSKCCGENENSTLNTCHELVYYTEKHEKKYVGAEDYGIYVNGNCTISRRNFVNANWSIVENGHVDISNAVYRHFEYCLIDDLETDRQMLVVCNERHEERLQFFIICILLQTSTFLIIPRVIHYIGELKHATFYKVYFFLLAVSYIAAVTGITIEKFHIFSFMKNCTVLGYIIIFFSLSSFYWFTRMNCYILKMFKTKSMDYLVVTKLHKNPTFYFEILCWAFVVLTITCLILSLNFLMGPSAFSPNIDMKVCWFSDTFNHLNSTRETAYGELIYYLAPMSVLILINGILFVLSSISFYKMRKKHRTADNLCRELYQLRKVLFIEQTILFLVIGFPWLVALIWKSVTIGFYCLYI